MDAAKGLLVLIVAGALGFPSAAFGQSGWSGNTPSSSSQTMYDRYGQPIVQRAQTAASETGSSLRDGFDAGVKAAEQSINNWANQPASATSAPAWSNTPSAPPAPPVWPSSQASSAVTPVRGSAPAAVNAGWSSIGTNIAAPPLLVPNSPMLTPNFGSISSTGSRSGQNNTVASNDTQPLHSVLTDPAKSSPTTSPTNTGSATDWSAGWSGDNGNSGQASINRPGTGSTLGGTSRDTGFAPLQGSAGSTAASDPRYGTGNLSGASTQPGSSWSGSDSWSQTQPPSLSAANGAVSVNRPNAASNQGTASFTGGNPQSRQFAGQTTVPQFTGQQAGQNTNGTNSGMGTFGNYNPAGATPGMPNQMTGGANQYGQTLPLKSPTEAPWMPLIASVLTLAGSLAANLYLGVSYLDARQKYQSLVRKTAETFRRVKAVAA